MAILAAFVVLVGWAWGQLYWPPGTHDIRGYKGGAIISETADLDEVAAYRDRFVVRGLIGATIAGLIVLPFMVLFDG